MKIIGLTGSIGMGKSTTADFFRRLHVPVHDADATVHRLMGPKGAAVEKILACFPNCGDFETGIDRQVLGAQVFQAPSALKKLEAILHPLVRHQETLFLRQQHRENRALVVLDIPLLFETQGHHRCDYVVVVSASTFLQRQRVLARAGMTAEKFAAIIQKQTSDQDKRRQADFLVHSGLGRGYALRQVKKILATIKRGHPHA